MNVGIFNALMVYPTKKMKKNGYWEKILLAKFWSLYDLVYSPPRGENIDTSLIPLMNNVAFIKRRSN